MDDSLLLEEHFLQGRQKIFCIPEKIQSRGALTGEMKSFCDATFNNCTNLMIIGKFKLSLYFI